MTEHKLDEINTVIFENFGPIREAKIRLSPLTILVGPNNSGKSFAALALHGLINILNSYIGYRSRYHFDTYSRSRIPIGQILPFSPDITAEEMKLLNSFLKIDSSKPEELILSKEFVQKQIAVITTSLGDAFSHEIERLFGAKSKRLLRFGTNEGLIKSTLGGCCLEFKITRGKWDVSIPKDARPEVKIVKVNGRLNIITSNNYIELKSRGIGYERDDMKVSNYYLLREVYFALIRHIVSINYNQSFFLPAARSGILQAYLGLAKLLISQSALAGVRPVEVPGFSGAVADLVGTLVTMRPRKTALYNLAKIFEDRSNIGEIKLGRKRQSDVRDIEYRWHDQKTPLSIASSTVTEIAPLIIYTKYLLDEGSVLMIEEPEAHLHPANQRLVAEYLAQLVKHNVIVVLTTHSEYLVNQISLFVQASKLTPIQLKKLGYDQVVLEQSEVSIHVSEVDSDLSSKIMPSLVDSKGVDQEEFLKIRQQLYGDTVKLESELDE